VPAGGLAFEIYLRIMGSDRSLAKLTQQATANASEEKRRTLSEMEFHKLSEWEAGKFHGFILMAIGNVGNNAKKQLYYPTFSARFHGLSRQGVQLMSHFGVLLSITTYDRYQVEFLRTIETKKRYELDLPGMELY
jgi:hypothetical protein